MQQAMAHGLPVVVAEADGTQRELVRPGNGWLVVPGDLPGLIETLQELWRPRPAAAGWAEHPTGSWWRK
jgi:glycosyltransferase involved in cell wall biosynthesis